MRLKSRIHPLDSQREKKKREVGDFRQSMRSGQGSRERSLPAGIGGHPPVQGGAREKEKGGGGGKRRKKRNALSRKGKVPKRLSGEPKPDKH